MRRRAPRYTCVAALALALASLPALAQDAPDAYTHMLDYLTSTRIEGHALAGATGAIAVNLAAGDGNLQTNARAIAVGPQVQTAIGVQQHVHALHASAPDAMEAVIGGDALSGARGLISINQASGVGNREANTIAIAVRTGAPVGLEEAGSDALASLATQSGGAAGGRPASHPSSSPRQATVAGTALRGSEGVVQLNQIAGMGNMAGNRLLITVDLPPR